MTSTLALTASKTPLATAGPNLLVNHDFEDGLAGWQLDVTDGVTAEAARLDGRTVARLSVPESAGPGPHALYQEFQVQPGQLYLARAEALRVRLVDGTGAFIESAYYDEAGELLSACPHDHVVIDGAWTRLFNPMHFLILVPEKATRLRLRLVFKGHGEACFTSVLLTHIDKHTPPLAGPLTLRVTREVACDSLFGFGVEDDGWFYHGKNLEEGVNEEDVALRERRIQYVRPGWIRSFIWIKDWCPSADWKTFTFDSDLMASHYRALDLYQRMGVPVNIAGVEWGFEGPYDDAKLYAHAVGELYEHLIRIKGYTCIKYWTLCNEPCSDFTRTRGYRFEHFLAIHREVTQEFKRRGLEIQVFGSDDADSLSFFETCMDSPEYYALTDICCSHTYPRLASLGLLPDFFDERMKIVERQRPRKPFVIGECGVLDDYWFTSMDNALSVTYDYAVHLSTFVIEGLNRGVAGFSFWCMHEVYYPGGGRMQPGLWSFKDYDWKPRAIYYAWSALCRNTKAGDPVHKVESSSPGHVIGSVVGNTLFWVNRGDQTAEVIVEGMAVGEVRIMEEKTIEGDGDCGVVEKVNEGRFTVPPRSFGYAR